MTADERLTHIHAKVERAKKHLMDLETLRDRFIQSEPYTVASKPHPEPGYENFNLFFMSRIERVPNEISAAAGDAFHNLRCAREKSAGLWAANASGGYIRDHLGLGRQPIR